MSAQIKLLLFTAALSILAAIRGDRYIANARHYDNPENCYHKELKLTIKKGDYVRPINIGDCLQFSCWDDGVILVNECPHSNYRFGCNKIIPVDYTKEFPTCCAHIKCV